MKLSHEIRGKLGPLREFWEWWQLLLTAACDWWSVSAADSRDKERRGGVTVDRVELIHPFLTPWTHPSSQAGTLLTPPLTPLVVLQGRRSQRRTEPRFQPRTVTWSSSSQQHFYWSYKSHFSFSNYSLSLKMTENAILKLFFVEINQQIYSHKLFDTKNASKLMKKADNSLIIQIFTQEIRKYANFKC